MKKTHLVLVRTIGFKPRKISPIEARLEEAIKSHDWGEIYNLLNVVVRASAQGIHNEGWVTLAIAAAQTILERGVKGLYAPFAIVDEIMDSLRTNGVSNY